MTSLLPINILVLHYRFGIPTVMLTPWLRSPAATLARQAEDTLVRLRSGLNEIVAMVRKADPSAKRLSDITAPFWKMRELILCPRDLEIPDTVYEDQPEPQYIEASVDLSRKEEGEFPWERLDPGKRLLFCSMGSQSHISGKAIVERILRAALDAVAQRPDWQLVLATGRLLAAAELGPIPDNALVVGWAPQLGLLRRAAAMITHGGLGTVKECIFHEVPMVVYPLMRDQPDNARRIVRHGLGLAGDPATATAGEIAGHLARVDEEPAFRDSLARMRARFVEIEESGIGVRRIEEVLGSLGLSSLPPQAALAGSVAGL